jgi:5'-nucleotidase
MYSLKTVLLTNDDGYDSEGIRLLFHVLKKRYRVIVIAPDSEKSGVGHSFTYHKPLYYRKIENSYAEEVYSVSGSPADCVKFAVSHLLPETPDLIVSGMNMGENSGISSFYSGTVAAAREGAFWKIRSISFSLCEKGEAYAAQYADCIPDIIGTIMENDTQFEKRVFFNVNFPPCHPDKINGLKITKQSMAFFDDRYKVITLKNNGKMQEGFRIYGNKVDIEESYDYDSRALLNNWITVTPHTFDSTSYEDFLKLKKLERTFFKGSYYV